MSSGRSEKAKFVFEKCKPIYGGGEGVKIKGVRSGEKRGNRLQNANIGLKSANIE